MGHPGLAWALTSDFCPYKKREIWDADAYGEEGQVTTEAEIGVVAASQGAPRIAGEYQRLAEQGRLLP